MIRAAYWRNHDDDLMNYCILDLLQYVLEKTIQWQGFNMLHHWFISSRLLEPQKTMGSQWLITRPPIANINPKSMNCLVRQGYPVIDHLFKNSSKWIKMTYSYIFRISYVYQSDWRNMESLKWMSHSSVFPISPKAQLFRHLSQHQEWCPAALREVEAWPQPAQPAQLAAAAARSLGAVGKGENHDLNDWIHGKIHEDLWRSQMTKQDVQLLGHGQGIRTSSLVVERQLRMSFSAGSIGVALC